MRIVLKTNQSPANLMRRAGYGLFSRHSRAKEATFIKRVGSADYPRFHAYVKKESGQIIINLHLDQKRPSYSGSHAHNAEYEGLLLIQEVAYVSNVLKNLG